MSVPDFQSFMLPLLQFTGDGKEHNMNEAREYLADYFSLSDDDLAEKLPSGRQATFTNRVSWAKVYLARAGLLDTPQRGLFIITELGQSVLAENIDYLGVKVLNRFPAFRQFHQPKKDCQENGPSDTEVKPLSATPEEILEETYQQLKDDIADELLKLIKNNSPEFFEKLVVELLVKMGYGGSVKEAGKATKRTNDEGIDGIIKEDRLGLDAIYLQAKKWENTVSRPEIQKFVGALHGQRAKKGVFITTSQFSSGAVEYASNIDPKIVLINGGELVNLMIDHGLGVTSKVVYDVKKIDTDFFTEE